MAEHVWMVTNLEFQRLIAVDCYYTVAAFF